MLHGLRARGHRVGRNRIIRLMRAEGLRARCPRRCVVTTDSRHQWAPAPDRLQRRFRVRRPTRYWVADLTYLNTGDGWLYLAVILDLDSRRVIGWATRPTLHIDLTTAALHMALARRRPGPGLIHHSDRGIQYASAADQRCLAAHQVRASTSRRGNCWDNAVAESFFSTLKHALGIRRWPTHEAAGRDVAASIDDFYNPVRLHSTLGYQTPAGFEARRVM